MDNKKLLLVSVSVGIFLVVVIGASILAFSPKRYSPVDAMRQEAELSSTGAGVVSPGAAGATLSEAPPPVPPFETSAYPGAVTAPAAPSVSSPDSRYGGEYPPAGSETTAQARDDSRGNVIYINGDDADNAVRVERLNDGSTKTIITLPSSSKSNARVPEYEYYPPAPAAAAPPPAAPDAGKQIARAEPRKTETSEPPAVRQVVKTNKAQQSDYWVQTGSFASKSRADNAKDFLAGKGIVSVVFDSVVKGKTVYRVRVGPYTSQNEADYWLSLIKEIDGMQNSQVWKSPARL